MGCPGCFNRGAVYDPQANRSIICVVCKGKGHHDTSNYDSTGTTLKKYYNCNHCTCGQIEFKEISLSEQCNSCNGSGKNENDCLLCFGTGTATYRYKKKYYSKYKIKFFFCIPYIIRDVIIIDDIRIHPCGCDGKKYQTPCKGCDGCGKLTIIKSKKCETCDGIGTLYY